MNSTNKLNKEISELYQTIKKLRSDKGCPWDKEQTSESLAQYLLQETYEVLESIDNNGLNLKEELGDLLFQILFQSVIAEENKEFNFVGIIKTLKEKLIERHPHVFQEKYTKLNESQVIDNWGKMKKDKLKNEKDYIKNITKTLPSLSFAHDLIKKSKDIDKNLIDSNLSHKSKKDNYLDNLFEITIQASSENIDLENEFRKYLNKKQLDIINKL
tara:strand:- start:950 stop:1594 length:645 start_codon:yes stop_codon:yes gene_type:complete